MICWQSYNMTIIWLRCSSGLIMTHIVIIPEPLHYNFTTVHFKYPKSTCMWSAQKPSSASTPLSSQQHYTFYYSLNVFISGIRHRQEKIEIFNSIHRSTSSFLNYKPLSVSVKWECFKCCLHLSTHWWFNLMVTHNHSVQFGPSHPTALSTTFPVAHDYQLCQG